MPGTVVMLAISHGRSEYSDTGNADKHFDRVISINTPHQLGIWLLWPAFREIERVGRRAKYIRVEAYRNEREKVKLLSWQLACRAIHTPDESACVFKATGYTGDHESIYCA